VERDEAYYREMQLLQNSVAVDARQIEGLYELGIDKVAELIASSGKVKQHEIEVSKLARSRYLVHLPSGLLPETVIQAAPPAVWDLGVTLHVWSLLDEAAINISLFKVILNIEGVPPHLYRDHLMIRAISGFSVYLGTVPQKSQAHLASWTVAVATEDLVMIPRIISMRVGGMEYDLPVQALKWKPGQIYKVKDMPKFPPTFKRPEPRPKLKRPIFDYENNGDNLLRMSRVVLKAMCADRDPQTLSVQIQAVLARAKSICMTEEEATRYLHQHKLAT
jgi:hypothetical protein